MEVPSLGTCYLKAVSGHIFLFGFNTDPVTPSFASVFLTTSIAPLYIPGDAVCNRVLVKSNG